MSKSNSSKRPRPEDFRVDGERRPGWIAASQRGVAVGEEVYCIGGAGVVAAVLGRTGDGSRLLEIRLADLAAKPFFAAASNVLVAPH